MLRLNRMPASIALAVLASWHGIALGQSALDVTKSFSPSTINSGGTSVMTISMTNNLRLPDPLFSFSDNFPAGMSVAPGTATTQCGAER